MNKLLVGVISSLATIGLVGGAGAIALSSPNVRDNLNISYGNNEILGNDLSQNNNTITKLSKELAETNTLLSIEQDKVNNLTSELNKLNEDKLQYKIDIANLKGDNANLEKEITTLNNSLISANNKIANYETRISSYQTQITNLRNTNTNLNNQITTLRNTNSTLKNDLNIVTNDLEMLTQELEVLQQENSTNVELIDSLRNEISLREIDIQNLNKTLEDNQEHISSLENEISTNVETIHSLEYDISLLNSEINVLNDEILAKEQQLNLMQETINANNVEIAELTTNLENKDTEIAQLYSTISTLQNEITTLTNRLNYLETALNNKLIINYVVDGEDNILIQDMDSPINFVAPTKSGYEFIGWSLTEAGEIVTEDIVFVEDTTLYAQYQSLPTYNDFFYKTRASTGEYVCYKSKTGKYQGVYVCDTQSSYARQVYPVGNNWSLLTHDNVKSIILTNTDDNVTLAYLSNAEDKCVKIADVGYTGSTKFDGGAYYLYNETRHQLYNATDNMTYLDEEHIGNIMNVSKKLDSGNYLLGSREDLSSRIYFYNVTSKQFKVVYDNYSRWSSISEMCDGMPMIFSTADCGKTRFLVFVEDTEEMRVIDTNNAGIYQYNSQLDSKINRVLIQFENASIVYDHEQNTTHRIDFCIPYSMFKGGYSSERNDVFFKVDGGFYFFDTVKEEYTHYEIGNIKTMTTYSKSYNILIETETGDKYVYIYNTNAIETFDEAKDYTTYIGE